MTKGMPSTPSQKSIDVCRSAPTIVMWWTPWLWSFRMCSLASVLDELRLVFAATQASERDELHSRLDDGNECTHHLADGRGEDIDAANDQHVVGAPGAAHARRRAAAPARGRPDLDVIACAEPQERSRPMAEVREHELAGRTVMQLEGDARFGIDQLGMDEAARAQVHPVLLHAFAPQRHADVADAHRFGDACPPPLLELRAEGRLAAAGLTRHEHALDARASEVNAPLCRRFDDVRSVGGSEHCRLGTEELDRPKGALGVPGADGNVTETDAVERGQRRARDERARVVSADDALAGGDAGRCVAARRRRHPVVEILRRQRHVAGRTGGTARRIDADDLGRRRAKVRADRIVGRTRRPDLALLGERQPCDVPQAARRRGGGESSRSELLPVEGRALEEISELGAIAFVVERVLLRPRPRLDLGREHHSGPRSYSIAASAFPAIRKPTGCCCSSARCASRPAVRARIGTALTTADAKPRSSITAAIGIETFIVSGLFQVSTTASRRQRASWTCGPLTPRASASSRIRSARGSSGRCSGWPNPGARPPDAWIARAISPATVAGSTPDTTRACASSSRRAHSSAAPRMTGPAPRIPAATAPWSDAGSAAIVIRAAMLLGIIPCSAIETSSRSRKKRSSSDGSRPVSSRWKYAVKLSRPIRSPARSRPRTSTLSG